MSARLQPLALAVEHEFEALLSRDVNAIGPVVLPDKPTAFLKSLDITRRQYKTPEQIYYKSPPSKRLLAVFGHFRKGLHAPLIADRIGMEKMQNECPYFND